MDKEKVFNLVADIANYMREAGKTGMRYESRSKSAEKRAAKTEGGE